MFQSTRIKLTVWYLFIIILVSIVFSLVIYALINEEYSRIEHFQRIRQERIQEGMSPFFEEFRPQLEQQAQIIPEARTRLQIMLLLVNLGILGLAGFAGYFLAGRTLRPIKEMVDEQNRFITDSSHELRTPVTSLKTATEVYLRGESHTLKESDNLHQSNLKEINNLQALMDNLIKLTQYQKSNGNIIFENISLAEVVKESLKKVAVLARYKNITVKNLVKNQTLEADRQSLCELLVIFLDNAIKYSSKNTAITLSSKVLDHTIVIDVKDEGIGIDKKDIPFLFDRFYRADKSRTKNDVGGYGLGLSIAKQIIDKHNGFITVSSNTGKGTTFEIHLPIKQRKF